MSNGREANGMPEGCRECEHWDKVKNRERIHSVINSVVDKIEAKVTDPKFNPSLGDYFKALDALAELERVSGGSKSIAGRWIDSAPPRKN